MIVRTAFAAVVAAALLATPAAAGATEPDVASMVIDRADLPSGASVLGEGRLDLSEDEPGYHRDFKLRRSSGFARLDSIAFVFKTVDDAKSLLAGTRSVMRDPDLRREVAKLTALQLGVRPRRVRVGRPRPVKVGDGGFTVSIRVNRRIALVVGVFRVDRAFGEVDARGAKGPAGLRRRTLAVMRVAADRTRHGLSPQSLTAPTVTGSATVGGVLRAALGTWSDATSYSYAWQRCTAACVAVPGATQAAYTVTAADAGATLRVVVTAANAVGQTAALSAPTAPVPAP
jgi:hypothetical protein